MSQKPQDWEMLQAAWQAYQPPLKQIEKKINWVSWRMAAILLVDVMVLIGYLVFITSFLSSDAMLHVKIWNALMGLVLIAGVWLDFKIRLPLFRLDDRSASSILKFYLKRIEAGVELGRLSRLVCQWIYLPAIIFVTLSRYLEPAAAWNKFIFSYVFLTVLLGVCWLISRWYENKKKREFKQLSQLWQEFIADDV